MVVMHNYQQKLVHSIGIPVQCIHQYSNVTLVMDALQRNQLQMCSCKATNGLLNYKAPVQSAFVFTWWSYDL